MEVMGVTAGKARLPDSLNLRGKIKLKNQLWNKTDPLFHETGLCPSDSFRER